MTSVLDEVLFEYGLKDYKIIKTRTRSYNEHYEIIGDDFHYNLRYHKKPLSYDNMLYEYEVLEYLNSDYVGIVPKIQLTTNGDICCINNNKYFTLFCWLSPGPKLISQTHNYTDINCAAEMLANIHCDLKNFKPSVLRENDIVYFTIDKWEKCFYPYLVNQIAPALKYGKQLNEHIIEVNELIKKIDLTKLSYGINHGDYKPCNVLFENHRVKTVFDFDCSHEDYYLNDLACAILSFSKMSKLPSFDINTMELFLQSYNKINSISDYEIESISTFMYWKLIKDVAVFFKYNSSWWDEVCVIVETILMNIRKIERDILLILGRSNNQ